MSSSTLNPSPALVLASTFYTAALEKPFAEALVNRGYPNVVACVPYNQLYTFLLNPQSLLPQNTAASVVVFVRTEDLIRLELVQLGKNSVGQTEALVPVFRQRTEELLAILGQISRLRLTVIFCPPAQGAFDISFLGNAPRVAEHKIAAELRKQRRHLIVNWSEFERATTPGIWFNLAGDRLGHVPFTPDALNALAEFVVAQMERIPNVTLDDHSEGGGDLDLKRFLASLNVEVSVAPLAVDDRQPLLDLVRHTTHFINLVGRKWDTEGLGALLGGEADRECWVVRVQDRFGSYGVSGAVSFGVETGVMRIQLLFLSCTVLGKQVEHAVFGWMAQTAEERRASYLEVPFERGPDNQGLNALLVRLGAEEDSTAQSPGIVKSFRLAVKDLADRVTAEAPNAAVVPVILSRIEIQG
jgi:hypothetical protein